MDKRQSGADRWRRMTDTERRAFFAWARARALGLLDDARRERWEP